MDYCKVATFMIRLKRKSRAARSIRLLNLNNSLTLDGQGLEKLGGMWWLFFLSKFLLF